jgi:hypothetical protein
MLKLVGSVGVFGIVLVAALASFPASSPAHAQATRTWVSGVGDDVNPCSRTAPCKTFAGAISKTAAGGIINCIDSGGFGALTITKAITVDCASVMAGVLAVGTNGININAPAADRVTLRGLSIEGGNGQGLVGINFINGGTVHVESCRIFGFRTGNATGIQFAVPNAVGAELIVSDTTISDSGTAATNGGIVVRATGTGTARVMLNRVQLHNNFTGLRVDGTAGTGGGAITLAMRDSAANGSNNAGVSVVAGGVAPLISVFDNVISVANATGLSSEGAQARALITRFTAIANAVGLSVGSGGQIISYRDNHINNNFTSNGAPTSTQDPQ